MCIDAGRKETHINEVYRAVGNADGVWGLEAVIKVIDPEHVAKYAWLISNLTPLSSNLQMQHLYSVSYIKQQLNTCTVLHEIKMDSTIDINIY